MATYRKAEKGWYALRYEVLMRDNFTCQYCGQYAPNVRLEVNHIVPVVEGGTDDPSNLVTSCYACNRGKEGLRTTVRAASRREPVPTVADMVVELLQTKGPMSVADISLAMGKTKGHMGVVLNALKGRGLAAQVGRGIWTAAS